MTTPAEVPTFGQVTTLLELTGALGITSILGIAAITSMSPAPGQADDVRARASLHAAVVAALASDGVQSLDDALLTEAMTATEPGLGWTMSDSPDANVLSVATRHGSIGLAARSSSGSCFVARVSTDGNVTIDELVAPPNCTGLVALSPV